MNRRGLPQNPCLASFRCTRCGACCNSAPQLSLPELLHHEQRFIGCLGIHRLVRPRPGAPRQNGVVSHEDCQDFEAFASEYYHQAGAEWVLLAMQAYDDPSRAACPELGDDQLCKLEHDNKPLVCRNVPLEALLPDRWQLALLSQRAEQAAYKGADCIQLTRHEDRVVLVEGDSVLDAQSRSSLEARREALRRDRQVWGNAVFELMRSELFDHAARVAALPTDGYLSLPPAAPLAVVASVSRRARQRVAHYLGAQIELLLSTLETAPEASPSARQLQSFLGAAVALRARLQADTSERAESADTRALQEWLGV